MLWFEYEISPRVHVFKYSVPSWWCCWEGWGLFRRWGLTGERGGNGSWGFIARPCFLLTVYFMSVHTVWPASPLLLLWYLLCLLPCIPQHDGLHPSRTKSQSKPFLPKLLLSAYFIKATEKLLRVCHNKTHRPAGLYDMSLFCHRYEDWMPKINKPMGLVWGKASFSVC